MVIAGTPLLVFSAEERVNVVFGIIVMTLFYALLPAHTQTPQCPVALLAVPNSACAGAVDVFGLMPECQ